MKPPIRSTSRRWRFGLRLTDSEFDQFERVAKSYTIPVAAMLRMLVQREDERLAGHILNYPKVMP